MVAAGNLSTDKAIVNKLSSALQSRLIHLFIEPDIDQWMNWAYKNEIDYRIKEIKIFAFCFINRNISDISLSSILYKVYYPYNISFAMLLF